MTKTHTKNARKLASVHGPEAWEITLKTSDQGTSFLLSIFDRMATRSDGAPDGMQAQQHVKPPVSLSADPMNPSLTRLSGCQVVWAVLVPGSDIISAPRPINSSRTPGTGTGRVGRILRVACKARRGGDHCSWRNSWLLHLVNKRK